MYNVQCLLLFNVVNLTKIQQRLGFVTGLNREKLKIIIMIIFIIIINKTNNAVAAFVMCR